MPSNADTNSFQHQHAAAKSEPARTPSAGESAALSSIDLSSMAMVECPTCQVPNPRTRKFCGACGQALREPCVECGTETMLGEAFCGGCGVDLHEALENKARMGEADLQQARLLRDKAMFNEAQKLLASWIAREQLALADVARRAAELSEEIKARQQTASGEAELALDQAREAFANCQWSKVISIIEQLPDLLRRAEHDKLHAHAQEALEELRALTQEIRIAIQEGQLIGLLPKVDRALELSHDDERLLKLSKQLQQRFSRDAQVMAHQRVEEAEQKVALFHYAEALELLEQVPEPGRDKQFQASYQRIRELAHLWGALRHTPTYDESLLVVAQRLAKHSPNDRRVPTIIDQLRQRAEKQKSRPLEAIAWAKASDEPVLGCAVKRHPPFGAIDTSKVINNALFVANADRLYVACGTALQGLRKATINTDLCPKPKSRLGRIGNLFQNAPKYESAWGVDLGDSGLKAVKLVHDAKDDSIAIESFDVVEHTTPLPALVNETQKRDTIAETLKRFLERNTTKGDAICLSVPGSQSLSRFLSVPPTAENKTRDLMQYEARQQIPVPLEQLMWDYHVWQPRDSESEAPRDAMLIATKQFHVSQRLQPFEDAGIKPDVLQCDCIALYNFFRYTTNLDVTDDRSGWSVWLDVGARATSFVACGARGIWYRSLPRGGNEWTQALVQKAKLSFVQAEQLKTDSSKARRLSDLHEAWRPALDLLVRDVGESMDAFRKLHRRVVIDRIWLTGGGAKLPGLHRHLVE